MPVTHLGVHYASPQEGCGKNFWIDVILTILVYIPGLIYALYIVLT